MSAFFRGKPACACLIEWLPAYEAELLARGLIRFNIDIYQLIGGAKASAGTHSEGGAFDIAQTSPEAIKVARQMGADATWHRPENWDGRGGISHTHGVLTGCPHNRPARYQIDAVRAGFNGLGKGGRGGKDTGPRPLSGRTWREGIAWHLEQQEQRKPKPKPSAVQKARKSLRDARKKLLAAAEYATKNGAAERAKALAAEAERLRKLLVRLPRR